MINENMYYNIFMGDDSFPYQIQTYLYHDSHNLEEFIGDILPISKNLKDYVLVSIIR